MLLTLHPSLQFCNTPGIFKNCQSHVAQRPFSWGKSGVIAVPKQIEQGTCFEMDWFKGKA